MLALEDRVGYIDAAAKFRAAAAIDSAPDLFHKLPDELVDHIISLLTLKALIATRSVARKWMRLSPVVNFNIRSDQALKACLESFSKQRANVKSVSINLKYDSYECNKFIQDLMLLVAKSNVYELRLCCGGNTLPGTIVSKSRSLIVLKLDGCRLYYTPRTENGKLDSLQVLSLNDVSFTWMDLATLFSISPNITHLSLKRCAKKALTGVLWLDRLKRLKNVQVSGACFEGIVTDSPDLCFLEYSSSETARKIDLRCCPELEVLKLKTKFDPQLSVGKLFPNCPFGYVHSLSPRAFYNDTVSIWLDRSVNASPNVCEYTRFGFRSFKFSVISGKARFQEQYTFTINTCFLKELRGLVQTCEEASVFTFQFHSKLLKEDVNIGELRNSCVSPVRRIKHLKLELTGAGTFPFQYSKVLIDAILCCCYPDTMTFKLSKYQKVFVEALSNKLRGERPKMCCKASTVKCWRHFLEDVEIKRTTRSNKRGKEYERINIRFQWL